MGNNPIGATSTKIFHFEVDGPGWDSLKLVTDPHHILCEQDRNAMPVDDRMVEGIAEDGVINPITVRKVGDFYEIISGRQRYKACVEAKRRYPDKKIRLPFRIMTLRDYQALKASAIENEHRHGDSIVSRGEKAQQMVEAGIEQDEICKLYGVEWRTIQNWITVYNASRPVHHAVVSGEISETTALKIARKPFEEQAELVEQATANGRKKPGRKKGDNRRRIRITATQLEDGGFCLDVSKCDDVELACVIEALDAELQNRREQCTENMTQKK